MAVNKCERCEKAARFYNLVLYKGPNGYRRYRVCDACKAELAANLEGGKPIQVPKAKTDPEKGKKK